MTGHVHNGSTWQRMKTVGLHDPSTGTVREMAEGWVYQGGVWHRIHANQRADTDLFGRPDSADIGADWAQHSARKAAIVSNAAQGGALTFGTGRQAQGWSVYQGGAFGGRLHTDNVFVRAQLKATSAPGGTAADNYTTIGIGWPDTWGTGTMLYASVSTGSGSQIVTCTGAPNGTGGSATGGSNQTTRATAGNVSASSLIELRREGNTVQFFVNGTPTMTWTDTASLRGTSQRRWGFCIEGNFPSLQPRYSSPGLETITAGDL